jgi:hypothetical protein
MMNRLKGLYRSWAIPCGGQQGTTWLEKLQEAGVRRRAERLYDDRLAFMTLSRQQEQNLVEALTAPALVGCPRVKKVTTSSEATVPVRRRRPKQSSKTSTLSAI